MAPASRATLSLALALSTLLFTLGGCSSASSGSGSVGSGGSGGQGGGGAGGGSGGGGPCQAGADCLESEYCHFADYACGLGEPSGQCVARPIECSHNPAVVCSCDGSVTLADCPELGGNDISVNGNCATPAGKFPCGYAFCVDGSEYCQRHELTGAAPDTFYGCVPLPEGCSADDSCACVSTAPYPCGDGTCADDADGHAVVSCVD